MRLPLVLLPVLVVAAACSDQTVDRADVTLGTGEIVTAEALDQTFEAAAADAGITGMSVAIINDGAVVYHRHFGRAEIATDRPVDDQTLFEGASLSKPIFGALVVDLAADGVLDLDTPLAEYLPHPDLRDDPRAALFTARQVLTHQTGLPNWRTDNPDDVLDIAFEPGTSHRYSGEGYEYLADVLMHLLDVDDRGLDDIFLERIAGPAGSQESRFVQDQARVDRKARGYADGEIYEGDIDYANDGFGAAYSIHTSAEDYAKLMIGLMNGPSLDQSERETFFALQNVPLPPDHPERAFGLMDWALGYAVYGSPPDTLYAHGGNNEGYSSVSGMLIDEGWGFVVLTNENQATDLVLATVGILLDLTPPTEE